MRLKWCHYCTFRLRQFDAFDSHLRGATGIPLLNEMPWWRNSRFSRPLLRTRAVRHHEAIRRYEPLALSMPRHWETFRLHLLPVEGRLLEQSVADRVSSHCESRVFGSLGSLGSLGSQSPRASRHCESNFEMLSCLIDLQFGTLSRLVDTRTKVRW